MYRGRRRSTIVLTVWEPFASMPFASQIEAVDAFG
jgi:hypothetical protein